MSISTAALAQNDSPARPPQSIYDNVFAVLQERYYDKAFRENELERLAAKLRPKAPPRDLRADREAAEKLLSKIPASHLGLLSEEAHVYLIDELSGTPRPTFGMHVVRVGSDYFTFFVLEGGPAADAGVLLWERVVSIDGEPEANARLDWPQKDAFLSVERDPPIHSILCQSGDEMTVVLERSPGERRSVQLGARPYSALQAARASARLLQVADRKVGYVHFWFIHSTGVPELLRDLFGGQFADADALLLDLRGRGGNGFAVDDILRLLSEWGRPVVALTDRQSRSAKDVLAYECKERGLARLVGERTAGAVIPVSFAPVGGKTVLMFPSFTLGEYTQKLELKGGVEPDVFVERAGPYSAGHDPILERGKEELTRILRTTRSAKALAVVSPTSAPVEPSAEELPPIELLIDRMVEALGGEKALRAHAHRTLRGTAELVGLPMKGEFVQKASAPDKSLVVMHLGDLLVRQGFDGEAAWSDTPMTGKQILNGAAAAAMKEQAQFYGPLSLKAAAGEISATRFIEWDAKRCVELKRVRADGMESYIYIDPSTWLNAGTRATVETPIGNVETETYLRHYRSFYGFLTASEIYVDSSVQRQLIRIDSVTFDSVPLEEYAPPFGAK